MRKKYLVDLREGNGFVPSFNDSMKYMLEQLPECEIDTAVNGELVIIAISKEAASLIEWLSTDCLIVREIGEEI